MEVIFYSVGITNQGNFSVLHTGSSEALSPAPASVMLLGMTVVGTSAANCPDIDENDNVQAIEVLNAVKGAARGRRTTCAH